MQIPPISQRLEHVRADSGLSLRAFHARLDEGWGKGQGRVSYEAARNYHYDRAPSTAYLERVSNVFGVRLPWLISGQGARTEQDERLFAGGKGKAEPDPLDKAVLDGLYSTLPAVDVQQHLTFEYRHLSAVAIKLAGALMRRGFAKNADTYRRAGALVGDCIAAPLRILSAGFGRSPEDTRYVQAYVTACGSAVEILAHYAHWINEADQQRFDAMLADMAREKERTAPKPKKKRAAAAKKKPTSRRKS